MTLILSGTDGLSDVDGSAATPAIRGTDPNTGIFFPATDTIAFVEGGTEVMRIDSAGQTKFSYNAVIEVTDNTNAALRITQLGTGNALLVEDATNPDATPFVISNNGSVIVGKDSALTNYKVDISTTGEPFSTAKFVNSTAASLHLFAKSRSTTPGTYSILSSGDGIASLNFAGDDGTAFITAASITASVDGTPGTNDMPGRLVFSTTADGASTPTERMRIDSTGDVGIGTTAPLTALNVNGTGGELIRISVTADGATQQEPALGFATGVTNTHPATKISALEFDASDSRASMLFYTRDTNSDVAPTERMRIDSAGNLLVGLTSATSGGGVLQVSNGITFPATQSASSNANTLDDYEEGTFTVTAFGGTTSGTTTYSNQQGSYTKIGRQVTISIRLTYSAMTGTGEIRIGSFPFTVSNDSMEYIAPLITSNLNWGGGSYIQVYLIPNSTNATLFYCSDDAGWGVQQCVNESAELRFTATYFV